MDKFLNLILGTTDVPTYLAAFVFAIIGLLMAFYLKTRCRDKNSPKTPFIFSYTFFARDNLINIIFSFLGIFLGLRFSNEYFDTGVTMVFALGLGLSLPKFFDYLSAIQNKARN